MKFKKLRKIYRIIFPKKITPSEHLENQLRQNNEIESYTKDKEHYLAKLDNSLMLKIRNENHSDYLVFQQVFNFKQYEIIINLIKLNFNVNEKKIIIDAGANVFYTSLYFSNRLKNVSIFAIEPGIENALICRENILMNNLEDEVHFYNRALSHKEGLKFQLDNEFRDSKDWAITTKEDVNGEIQGITLNEIVLNNKLSFITFLKVDIEGAERFIFDSNNDLSFLKITKLIAIEIHDEFKIRENVYRILQEFGFYIFEIGELTVGINKNI
jgi:FkbM family methyltransferase